MTSYIRISLGWSLLLSPLPLLAQGYSIEGNRIVVDRPELWNQWSYPKGTLTFEDDGSFHPIYIRKGINACLDAPSFSAGNDIHGGIKDAGSNREDASNVMDGDLHTYWEPDRSDTLSDWWVQIDLGRLVAATQIVLKFVEEGEGDPFLGLKVWTSSGEIPLGKEEMDWREAGKVVSNEEGRRGFVFELSPPPRYEVEGDQVQYVWVMVTDTAGEKKKEVTEEGYQALDPDWRGVIEYFRIGPTGEELPIRERGYYALPEDQRGSIRYYRREVPRLAEVEVWTLGDNIALAVVGRGGTAGELRNTVDGLIMSSSQVKIGRLQGAWGEPVRRASPYEIDLQATFWVDRVRLTLVKPHLARGIWTHTPGPLKGPSCQLWILAPSRLKEESLRLSHGDVQETYFEEVFPSRRTRFVELSFTHVGDWPVSVREIQVYGTGYASETTLTSPLIPVSKAKVLGTIHWKADTPSGTDIEICTRTGDLLREVTRYFDKGGIEVTLERYTKLPGFARGETKSEYVPAEGWSDWSRPYQYSGAPITSPSPREYLQIQVTMLSDRPDVCPSLRSLWIDAPVALSHRIVGEISPPMIARAGVCDTLSLFLRPSFLPSSPGFDGLLLHSLFPIEMDLVGLRIGKEQDFLDNTVRTLSPDKMRVVPSAPDSVALYLPEKIVLGEADLLEVQFETTIFLDNTSFEAFLLDSSFPGSLQKVDEGDATSLVDNQTMHVEIPIDSRIIRDVEIHPNPFTPNGDGINDEVTFSFSVFKIFGQKTVEVAIYDVSGRRVRELEETREVGSGRYEMVWDGRDEGGRMVRPGMYVIRIHVGVDVPGENADHYTRIRSVGVVY